MGVRVSGVTLIELMLALAVLAILGAIAAPSFANLYSDAARTSAVNEFFHSLFLARSESIRRGAMVTLCKSADGRTCAHRTGAWTDGWMVFVNADTDEPPIRDDGEEILAVYSGWKEGAITSNRQAFSFRPQNQGVINGTVVFCDSRGSDQARAIIISHTGRPRIARRDASNKALKC